MENLRICGEPGEGSSDSSSSKQGNHLGLEFDSPSKANMNVDSDIPDFNLISASASTRETKRLLHHCLPVTCLKLLDGIILVASEGPSIVVKMAYVQKHNFQRFQLFPSQFIISGMEFIDWPRLEVGDDPAKWHKLCDNDKPFDFIYVGFIWAGSEGTVVRLTRSVKGQVKMLEFSEDRSQGQYTNRLMNFDFVPVTAKWLEGGNVLALLSVLNILVIYERVSSEESPENFTGLRESTRIKCSKSETLFSGKISGKSKEDLRIFAGTVFNGIMVWDVSGEESVIRHELKCHDGIVFSLEYYSSRKLLLSTSDDRTVAVWKFSGTGEEETVKLHRRFYGHDARVWKALAVHDYIISVGESSEVRVNNFDDGELHKSWRAHDGAPIFTCDYDEDFEILYTGGSEGSIRKWPKWWYRLKPKILPFDVIPFDPETEDKSRIQGSGRWSKNNDYPKTAALLDLNHVLLSMESGRVMGLNWQGKQFDLLYDSRCEGYQMIRVSPDHKVVAVAGNNGHFYTAEIFFTENEATNSAQMCAKKVFMTKLSWNIMSLIWLDVSRLLIVCFNRIVALLLKENDKGERSEVEFIQTFELNLSRPVIPAAVEIKGKFLVLGDELGTLHLLRYHESNEVISKYEDAHKEGVTSLLYHDSQLYSSGRDGKVRIFSLETNPESDLDTKFVPLMTFSFPFEWVTGIYINLGQTLVCGFLKEDFVVHSINEKRTIAKIPCGGARGGSRKWDFKYGHGLEGSRNAAFTFVRDKEIFYNYLPMEGYLNVILKEGLHSRTINCAVLVHSYESENKVGYITGSEDGSLKWFQWDVTNQKNLCIQSMENHVSSVRSAWKITTVANRSFLFTGGGRSQLCIYKLDNGKMGILKEIVLVKTTCKQTEGDVRIMDIVVVERDKDELWCFSACSDGYVRVLYFNTETQKFKIAALLVGNDHAVMRIQLLRRDEESVDDEVLLCGVTSNGYLILWKWSDEASSGQQHSPSKESSKTLLPERKPEFKTLLRRTAFLSMKVRLCRSYDRNYQSFTIVCGGDDCSVSIWSLVVDRERDVYNVKSEWIRDQNQRGAVVGVDIDEKFVYAISNDQIASFWNLLGEPQDTRYAGVSDCQGFLLDKTNQCILCFGKGVSWIPVPVSTRRVKFLHE